MHSGLEDKSKEQNRGWDDRFGDFLTNLLLKKVWQIQRCLC